MAEDEHAIQLQDLLVRFVDRPPQHVGRFPGERADDGESEVSGQPSRPAEITDLRWISDRIMTCRPIIV